MLLLGSPGAGHLPDDGCRLAPMKRVHFAAALGATALALVACQLVAGLEDRTVGDAAAGSDAGLPSDAGDADVSSGPDTSACEQCGGKSCVALASDPANCGYCGHACQGCAEGLCPPTTLATFTVATAMGIDATNVYVSTTTAIFSVPKSGGGKQTISNYGANSIAVANGRVYFTFPFSVWDVATTGGGTEHLITSRSSLDASAPRNQVLVVDPPTVFWVTASLNVPGPAGIFSVSDDGGGLTTVVAEDAGLLPQDIKVDPASVYYTDMQANGTGVLRVVPRGGGSSTKLGGSGYAPYELAFTGTGGVIWGTTSDVHVTSFDGGSQPPVITNNAVFNVAVVQGRAYWLGAGLVKGVMVGEIQMFDLATRARATVASGLNVPIPANQPLLAVDDQYVYWLEGAEVNGTATLKKTPR